MLLVVAESSGSSPGRQGYKMAVGADGELFGSIGGGVMEVNLVDDSRKILSEAEAETSNSAFRIPQSALTEQVHQKNSRHASGMICSGKQTVIFKLLNSEDTASVASIIDDLKSRRRNLLTISATEFSICPSTTGGTEFIVTEFSICRSTTPSAEAAATPPKTGGEPRKTTPSAEATATPPIREGSLRNPPASAGGTDFNDFRYTEYLGFKNDLYIVGGGHCALALSELMSKMDFHVTLFDDRPELNTIAKNRFAHEINIIDSYERIGDHVTSGENAYVVVMTLGYKTDEQVIRTLLDRDFKYFGVLGSNAKMSTMFRELVKEGLPAEKLERIRTPVGISINSRTPEEIAVSIAAEIISVKNSA